MTCEYVLAAYHYVAVVLFGDLAVLTMLQGMLSICLTWALLMIVLSGIGLLAFRLFRLQDPSIEKVLNSFWLGLVLVITILQLLHLWVPIGLASLVSVVTVGIAGAAVNVGVFRQCLRTRPSFYLLGASLCAVTLWLSNRAMGPIDPYDAGLYHLPAMKWVSSCAIVPGLGNLHCRFAVASSYWGYMCWLDAIPWAYRAHNIGAGLLLLGALTQIAVSVARVFRRQELHAYDVMRIIFIPSVVQLCFKRASSTSPDVAVFVLGMIVSWETCRLLFDAKTRSDAGTRVFLIIVLSACGLSLKPSFAMLGMIASCVAIARFSLRWWDSSQPLVVWMWVGCSVIMALLVVGPFLVRNVIVSGYPLYPSTLLMVDVPWRVPRHVPEAEARMIRAWAICPKADPAELLSGWKWFWPWLKGFVSYWWLEVNIPLLSFASGAIVWLARCCRRWNLKDLGRDVLLLLPPIAGLLFWFLTVPAPRFAGACFWWLGAGTWVLVLKELRGRALLIGSYSVLIASSLVALGFHVKSEKIMSPGGDHGYHPVPMAEMSTFVTDSGLMLYMPAQGDQAWDAPIPNTPYPHPGLALRCSDSIASGFWLPKEQSESRD